jgi:imidazolonepropionase-like amidohydrolase
MVEQFHAEGYDFIKVYNQIPEEGYRGIMETAKRLGMPVVGHAVRSVGIEGALKSGQHIAHMEEVIYGYFGKDLDEAKIPDLARRFTKAGISVIATLTAYHNIIRQVDDLDAMLHSPGMEYLHPRITRTWQPETNEYTTRFDQESVETFLGPGFAFQQKLVKAFTDAGVPVLVGTDASIPIVVPGYSTHQELEELVAAGLTPYQALAAGTSMAQKFLGAEDAGTIEAGKRADLVLLDANPLEDIRNSRAIAGAVIRGTMLTHDALDDRLEHIRSSIAADR